MEVNIKQLKHEKVTASSYRKYETIQYVGWFVKSVISLGFKLSYNGTL